MAQVSALQEIPVQQAICMIIIGLAIVILVLKLQMPVVDLEAAKLEEAKGEQLTYMLE